MKYNMLFTFQETKNLFKIVLYLASQNPDKMLRPGFRAKSTNKSVIHINLESDGDLFIQIYS